MFVNTQKKSSRVEVGDDDGVEVRGYMLASCDSLVWYLDEPPRSRTDSTA